MIALTILMPCLNEAETLATCMTKANFWIKANGIDAEVLIADNGSTDGSQKIASNLGARVINVQQRGYGSALFHGCMAARGKWVIMGDSDDSYDFSKLDAFVAKLEEGFDLVMGNRFLGGIAKDAMPWKNRYIGNPILTWIGRALFNCPSRDFHCGLRGVSKSAFVKMDLRTTGMEFASEMVIKASLFGLRIAEVPTTLSKDGRSRPPHLRPWQDGWRHLRFMLLFSPRWLFIFPGTLLFLLSSMIYARLLFGSIQIGNIIFDIHSLFLVQAFSIIGFLSVNFGLIIRMIGMREGLLKEHLWLKKLRESPTLEIGSVVSLTFICSGIGLVANTFLDWGRMNFGTLEYGSLLRHISVSTFFIMIGGITFLTSLSLGFLSLPTREQRF